MHIYIYFLIKIVLFTFVLFLVWNVRNKGQKRSPAPALSPELVSTVRTCVTVLTPKYWCFYLHFIQGGTEAEESGVGPGLPTSVPCLLSSVCTLV